jgi:hypothetical protein
MRSIGNPLTSSGFEPSNFQLVAQCLNQLCYRLARALRGKSHNWEGTRRRGRLRRCTRASLLCRQCSTVAVIIMIITLVVTHIHTNLTSECCWQYSNGLFQMVAALQDRCPMRLASVSHVMQQTSSISSVTRWPIFCRKPILVKALLIRCVFSLKSANKIQA